MSDEMMLVPLGESDIQNLLLALRLCKHEFEDQDLYQRLLFVGHEDLRSKDRSKQINIAGDNHGSISL